MPYNKLALAKKLNERHFDYLIFKDEIIQKVFSEDIIFTFNITRKSQIPDFNSFLISVMGAIGLDEFDMLNSKLDLTTKQSMLNIVHEFQINWNLNLDLEKLPLEEIEFVYQEFNLNNQSEIGFIIETKDSFIYFFTHHFYY